MKALSNKKENFFSCRRKGRASGRNTEKHQQAVWKQDKKHSQERILQDMSLCKKCGTSMIQNFCQRLYFFKINILPFPPILLFVSPSVQECWIKQIPWLMWQSTDFISSQRDGGRSFWSPYQLLCLEALSLLNKNIIKMQSTLCVACLKSKQMSCRQ